MNYNEAEAVKLTQKLISIPSENPNVMEAQIGDYIYNWFKDFGAEVVKDEVEPGRYNIVAKIPGEIESPNLVYICHMDTVPVGDGWSKDPFGGEIIGDTLYGRGASDMKGGLAAGMVAFKRIAKLGKKPKHTFTFIASIDEEGKFMLGSNKAVEHGFINKDSYVIDAEPSGLVAMPAYKGPAWFEITTKGVPCHAGNPSEGVDAIHAMCEIATEIKKIVAAIDLNDDVLGKVTVSFGKIHGGTKTNVVSGECVLEMDFRMVIPTLPKDMEEIVKKAIKTGCAKVPGSSATHRFISNERPPIKADPDSPLLTALKESYKTVMKKNCEVKALPAYTDAAIVASVTGNRNCMTFGPGYLALAHTIDEHVDIKQIADCADVLEELAKRILMV